MFNFYKKNIYIILFVLAVILSLILRFNEINRLNFFTHDQARDSLIVKRIIADKKFTLIGPQSSVGGIYSPPAYYYSLVLPLWIFGLNPIGPNVYTALIGVFTVILIYFSANMLFGKPAGVFAAFLLATSPIMVEMSKKAWNPNTLPFFSLLSFVLIFSFWKTNRLKILWLASASLGYTLSLHYSSFCLLPGFIFVLGWYFFKKKKIWPVILSLFIISLFFLPLLLFDIRHNFNLINNWASIFLINKKYSFNLFALGETILGSAYEILIIPLAGYFLNNSAGVSVPYEFLAKFNEVFVKASPISIIAHKALLVTYFRWGIAIFFSIIIFSIISLKKQKLKNSSLMFTWGWFLSAIIFSRFYPGKIYFFYYLFLFPFSFLFFSALLGKLYLENKLLKILTVVLLFLMMGINIYGNMNNYKIDKNERSFSDLSGIAKIISFDSGNKPFNLASTYKDPSRWDHQALDYRFFVEALYNKKPLDWYPENYRESSILYLISEGETINPVSSKIMEVEEFKPKKVIGSWNYLNKFYIYKLSN